MPNLNRIISWFNNRRKKNALVSVERRTSSRALRDATERLHCSLDRLDRATRGMNGAEKKI